MRKSFTAQAGQIARRGFTLTELLLVIIIIAILAAMTMTVQRSAMQSTRRERTIATIRKIDAALTSAYEKYQYRKPDVSYFINETEDRLINDFEGSGNGDFKALPQDRQNLFIHIGVLYGLNRLPWSDWLDYLLPVQWRFDSVNDLPAETPFAPYILRTIMLRELLLSDFPDCLAEVEYQMGFGVSPIHHVYQNLKPIEDPKQPGTEIGPLQLALRESADGDISADLLYLIVMNTSPETRGTFLDRETADTNENGIPEFVDGWGNPIRFVRWEPSIPESNRQPTIAEGARIKRYRELKRLDANNLELESANAGNYTDECFYSESRGTFPASDYDFFTYFEEYYPGLLEMSADPFDPMGSMNGWLLTPLIYSAGPDREYGMSVIDQEFCSPFVGIASTQDDPENAGAKDDNITNHNLE